ncbi:P-loop containing nucleoside triphosphate hydrolase protein [Neolentinus lepideus HHB14362 ss-1]|uniref:p-loop containing nucleoside triphosphate hydrolase protein n=1 Tax=Neolentinus lepideus HHB14362 ss-1 TaxID=1314782 RepID=A0A165N3Y4_9AGAM|nr:P-loop containing nucleoside triphosphate hydrolase protein [Neolentinus lepideus HHB14362 ss-1]
MADQPFSLRQDIFKASYPLINVVPVHCNVLTESQITTFLQNRENNFLGVAGAYNSRCVLEAVALATPIEVLVIRFSSPGGSTRRKAKEKRSGVNLLQDTVLCNPVIKKLSFNMDRLTTSMFLDFGIFVAGAIDIQHAVNDQENRHAMAIVFQALGGKETLHASNVAKNFGDETFSKKQSSLAIRAWASYHVNSNLRRLVAINTNSLHEKHLRVLAKLRRTTDRLDTLKPKRVKNDVAKEVSSKGGNLELSCTRYKTRVRRPGNQIIQVAFHDKGKIQNRNVRLRDVKGRSAVIAMPATAEKVHAVYTIGKPDPTNAEKERMEVILTCLQGSCSFFEQRFVLRIWEGRYPRGRPSTTVPSAIHYSVKPLNASQKQAVQAVLSDAAEHDITMIQGPPGTGKTTVIAACVTSMVAARGGRGIWLIAQSNVAVKNIAEKLADSDFFDFRILVSEEFHFDWHEHLYHKVDDNLIRSDHFPKTIVETERRLDEASQIEVGDYAPLLRSYGKSLNKLVFIGDDKQLAPYGQDDLGDLESIFEIDHLRRRAFFLDTQFRMPTPIGLFISRHVYNNRLRTVHKIHVRTSCRFVDVSEGKEESSGNSWKNVSEAQQAVRIARVCHARGQAFRLITPYDAQRGLLEERLKAEGLPWEDKCFNVDSFQGKAHLLTVTRDIDDKDATRQ